MIHPDSRVEGDLGCAFFVVLVSDCFLDISARFDVADQHLQVIQIVSEEPQYLLKDNVKGLGATGREHRSVLVGDAEGLIFKIRNDVWIMLADIFRHIERILQIK